MKIEDIRFKTVLESFIFGTSLVVVTMMIYESESIWSCLVQLMEQEAAHHLNFKWLTILLALQWDGILAKPSLVVSRILTFCSTLILVSILISIITIIVIYGALFLSFATIVHNCIQIHQEIVEHFDFKWLMIFLNFTWYGILA